MTKLEVVSADDSDSEVPGRSWRSFYKTNYTSKKSPRKFEEQETSPLFFQKWGKPIGFGGGILLLLLLIEKRLSFYRQNLIRRLPHALLA